MRAILISIRPEWVAKILNGKKTLEIRKTAPKCELPIEVYIYETKDQTPLDFAADYPIELAEKVCDSRGKVVAKFILKKAEEFIQGLNEAEYEHLPNFALKDYEYYGLEDLMGKACLNDEEITKYAPDLSFYAWHISDLVVFDKPKVIWQMKFFSKPKKVRQIRHYDILESKQISKAPQSWCYVEVRE